MHPDDAEVSAQVKDRHNGNILIGLNNGRLLHIDFGFLLDSSPGKDFAFERAAFKLTPEMARVFGGSKAEGFRRFCLQCVLGLVCGPPPPQDRDSFVRPLGETTSEGVCGCCSAQFSDRKREL